jgi:hypothetical protein
MAALKARGFCNIAKWLTFGSTTRRAPGSAWDWLMVDRNCY